MSNNVRKCKFYLQTADRTNSPLIPNFVELVALMVGGSEVRTLCSTERWKLLVATAYLF